MFKTCLCWHGFWNLLLNKGSPYSKSIAISGKLFNLLVGLCVWKASGLIVCLMRKWNVCSGYTHSFLLLVWLLKLIPIGDRISADNTQCGAFPNDEQQENRCINCPHVLLCYVPVATPIHGGLSKTTTEELFFLWDFGSLGIRNLWWCNQASWKINMVKSIWSIM